MSCFIRPVKTTLGLLTVAGLAATLIACGAGSSGAGSSGAGSSVGGSNDDVNAASSRDYAGAGSRWDVSLDDGDSSFSITRRENATADVDLTVEGSYENLDSGFLRLTVTGATGTDAPSAGDQAYALEVEGYAFILKPINPGSDQIIPMINTGECPTENITANWVIVKKGSTPNADDDGRDFYGSFTYDTETETPSLPDQYSLTNVSAPGGGIPGTGSCDDGLLQVTGAELYLTANGGAIVHTGIDNIDDASIIFALPKKPVSSIDNISADYIGLLFDGNSSSGDRVQPVSVDCSSAPACTGTIFTDIADNSLSAETVTINLSGSVDSIVQGFVTGTISDGIASGNLACMLDGDVLGTSKKVMSCVGQSPGDNSEMFNVLLVSQ